MIKTVLVCEAQVPLIHGGAELHARGVVDQLRKRGYRSELVSIPYKWYPKEALLAQAAAWRLIDLTEINGQEVDSVIATKFPTYFARHPNKVVWLFHQYRAIYELLGTPYSEFDHSEADVRLRDTLIRLDGEVIGESARLFTNARQTARRLEFYNGLQAEPLYHPPPLAEKLQAGPYGDYVLSVGRLEGNKRVELVIGAMAHTDRSVRLIIAGEGILREQLEETAQRCGVADRVTWAGRVDNDTLITLYSQALAVIFPPYREDYGYITLEAFLARRPLVTTTDAGGPLEFVEDGVNGCIVDPTAEAIGAAITRLATNRQLAASLGDAGYERARAITWDGVVEKLVGAGT